MFMSATVKHVRKKDVAVAVVCAMFLVCALGAIGERGRQRAKESTCRSIVGQLSGAWLKYADDHGGQLVAGDVGPRSWVDQPASSGVRAQELDAIKRGLLFPYVGDVRIYHCPAQAVRQVPLPSGWRSFAIAGGANGETWGTYEKVTKYPDLKDPAGRYVFVEDPAVRGIPLGSWQMNPRKTGSSWVDPVAMWHDRKSTLGFADGHAETHAWQDPSFIEWNLRAMYSPTSFSFSMMPPAREQNDIDYMAKGFPYKSLR